METTCLQRVVEDLELVIDACLLVSLAPVARKACLRIFSRALVGTSVSGHWGIRASGVSYHQVRFGLQPEETRLLITLSIHDYAVSI